MDGGSEVFGAAFLTTIKGSRELFPTTVEPPPSQKTLSLPPHLIRPADAIDFAHPTEQELARVFSFFRVEWVYEPTTFHLDVDDSGRPIEQVCPDFYLPEHDVYVELTTMRQSLVTKKNRKIRRLKEAFPTLQVRLLYRKDYDRLMGSVFGVNGHAVAPVPGRPIVTERQLQLRLTELAAEIAASRVRQRTVAPGWRRPAPSLSEPRSNGAVRSAESPGPAASSCEPVRLVGLGSGSLQFLTALEAELFTAGVGTEIDYLTLSRPYDPNSGDQVRLDSTPGRSIDGRDVVLVADIVSTGLNASYAVTWLLRHGARSVRLCTLFDRVDARILDVPIDWTGFTAPDDVLVGYGLSYQEQFDDLPAVSPLRGPSRSRSKTIRPEIPTEAP